MYDINDNKRNGGNGDARPDSMLVSFPLGQYSVDPPASLL